MRLVPVDALAYILGENRVSEIDNPNNKVLISVVVPVYSGADYLAELVASIAQLRESWISDAAPLHLEEVVFVNDDSVDESAAVLNTLSEGRVWMRVLHLSRNFGQHPATIAGILHTRGDWVITLDEDLQHPPEFIPAMLRVAVTGQLDIVYAHALEGVHENAIRDLGSHLIKRAIGVLAGDMSVSNFSSFRVIRGAIARSASQVCGHETYFDIALSWYSRRVGSLIVRIKDRRFIDGKKSGYSISKLMSHARRLIMSSRIKALRIGGYLGLLAMFFGFAFAAYVAVTEFLYPGAFMARGWSSLIISNMVFGGMTLFLISAILEYLSILVLRAQGKPTFFVVDRSGDAVVSSYLRKSRI